MTGQARRPTIFMMDLLATVPYYTAYLSRALQQEDVRVIIGSITYYLDPGCFSSRGLKLDPGLADIVGRYPLPRRPRRILKLLEALINLLALSARFLVAPPDIVHVQYLPMLKWKAPVDLWFVKLLRWRGSRVLLTVHDLLPHDSGVRYRTIFARLYRWVDSIICHSDHVRSRLADEFGVDRNQISVIPHGPFFYDQAPGNRDQGENPLDREVAGRVLWQGIVFPYKGVDVLLDAWQTVESRVPAAHLVIAGTGSPEILDSVRDQVARLHLQRVTLDFRFVSTEELIQAYRSAEVVVYPYRAITTSGALATGLALGKAVIATDLPVFRELLGHEHNALLVDVGNSAALAEAIIDLTTDPIHRKQLQEQVKRMRFGETVWPRIARDTVRVYAGLLARPGVHEAI